MTHGVTFRECWEGSKTAVSRLPVGTQTVLAVGLAGILYTLNTQSESWKNYPEVQGIAGSDDYMDDPEALSARYVAWTEKHGQELGHISMVNDMGRV
jgi:hypothetical protein